MENLGLVLAVLLVGNTIANGQQEKLEIEGAIQIGNAEPIKTGNLQEVRIRVLK